MDSKRLKYRPRCTPHPLLVSGPEDADRPMVFLTIRTLSIWTERTYIAQNSVRSRASCIWGRGLGVILAAAYSDACARCRMELSVAVLLLNLVVTSQAITNLQLLTADQVRVHLPITTRPSLGGRIKCSCIPSLCPSVPCLRFSRNTKAA